MSVDGPCSGLRVHSAAIRCTVPYNLPAPVISFQIRLYVRQPNILTRANDQDIAKLQFQAFPFSNGFQVFERYTAGLESIVR